MRGIGTEEGDVIPVRKVRVLETLTVIETGIYLH